LFGCYSFGFTTGHNASILKGITATGNAGPGMYYFLRTTQDIPSAVGFVLVIFATFFLL
jgi:hypothetical protein